MGSAYGTKRTFALVATRSAFGPGLTLLTQLEPAQKNETLVSAGLRHGACSKTCFLKAAPSFLSYPCLRALGPLYLSASLLRASLNFQSKEEIGKGFNLVSLTLQHGSDHGLGALKKSCCPVIEPHDLGKSTKQSSEPRTCRSLRVSAQLATMD